MSQAVYQGLTSRYAGVHMSSSCSRTGSSVTPLPSRSTVPRSSSYIASRTAISSARRTTPTVTVAARAGVRTTSSTENVTEASTEAGPLLTGIALAQGRREEMEDYAVVSDHAAGYIYAGVFDGHAGGLAAKFLSERLGDALSADVEKATKNDPNASLDDIVTDSFHNFDEQVLDYLDKEGGDQWNCGTTATVSLVRPDRLLVANVGDSRAVLSRNGKAMDLSSEHRPYGKSEISLREMTRISNAGGWINDGRVLGILAVSRAFGDYEFKRGLEKLLVDGVLEKMWTKEFAKAVNFLEPPVVATPDVLEMAVEEGDEFLIVASDGLWEVTTSSQAVQFVKRFIAKEGVTEDSIQKVSVALVDDAIKRRRTSDNVSCVVIALPGIGKSAAATSASKSKPKAKKSGGGGFLKGLFGR